MTLAEWCLLGAALLPLLTLAPLKPLAGREFDNANPRDPAFYETPIRSRVLGAHKNGLEAFPFFAASILLAEFRGAPQDWADALAIGFLVARLAYVGAYIGNRPTLRTMLWNSAFAFNLGLFFLAGFGIRGAVIATGTGLAFALGVGVLLELAERPS